MYTRKILFLFSMMLLVIGCASGPDVVPETLQETIEPTLTFSEVLDDPTVHQGKIVLLGGEVLSAKRLAEGTRLEILHLPLDRSQEPVLDRTTSRGRFLALESAFLDPATLPANTRVTVVGEITGVTQANLDEMEYRYPTLKVQHLHVWPEAEVNQPAPGPRYGIFGGGSTGGRVGGGVSIGIGF